MASVTEEIAALRGTRPATLRNLLRDPSFSRLYRAIAISSLGDWVGFVAVVSLVTRIGGTASAGFAVSGVMLARLLPSIVFGPFAGVLVDRFDRRRLMLVADIVRGIGYASLPFLPNLPYIFAVSFLIECLSLLWTPARDAIIPNLVPRRQLSNANTIALATAYATLPLGGLVRRSGRRHGAWLPDRVPRSEPGGPGPLAQLADVRVLGVDGQGPPPGEAGAGAGEEGGRGRRSRGPKGGRSVP